MDEFLSLAFFDVTDADQGIVLATYVDELGSDVVGTTCGRQSLQQQGEFCRKGLAYDENDLIQQGLLGIDRVELSHGESASDTSTYISLGDLSTVHEWAPRLIYLKAISRPSEQDISDCSRQRAGDRLRQ